MQEHNLNRDGPEDAEALTPAEREFEQTLAALSPARPSLVRERVLFEAGRAAAEAAARRRLFAWRAAAAVLLAALGLAVAAASNPRVIERDRIVYVPAPAAPETPAVVAQDTGDAYADGWAARERHLLASFDRPLLPSSDADYLTVRDAMVRWGVRGMPSPPAAGRAPAAAEPTVDGLLGIPPRKPAPGGIDLKGLLFGDRL
jgi:hypothetical protein